MLESGKTVKKIHLHKQGVNETRSNFGNMCGKEIKIPRDLFTDDLKTLIYTKVYFPFQKQFTGIFSSCNKQTNTHTHTQKLY